MISRSDVALPRCPFARRGLSTARFSMCAGFEGECVNFDDVLLPGDYPGKPRVRGVTCEHMVSQQTRLGWRPACGHPDGLPTRWPSGADARRLLAAGAV